MWEHDCFARLEDDALYAQCRLRRRLAPDHYLEQTTYLPVALAVVGNSLRLCQGADGWSDGWEVQSVSDWQRPGRELSRWSFPIQTPLEPVRRAKPPKPRQHR